MNLFNKLLNNTHTEWVSVGKPTPYPAPPAEPVEIITVRIALTPDAKEIESTLTTMFKPSTMKVRLPKTRDQSICFEAVLLQDGSITYDILQGFNYNSGIYTAKGTPTSIDLEPGDLLIVPRGVARQVSKVTHGSNYLYIGDSWDKDEPAEIT
jgi:hypothetical protein